jgi:hypothetical protein
LTQGSAEVGHERAERDGRDNVVGRAFMDDDGRLADGDADDTRGSRGDAAYVEVSQVREVINKGLETTRVCGVTGDIKV